MHSRALRSSTSPSAPPRPSRATPTWRPCWTVVDELPRLERTDRSGNEEHRPRRNGTKRPSPSRRARPRERRVRLESRVHGRRDRGARLHASGPDRDRLVRVSRRRHRGTAARGHRRSGRALRRRVGRDDQARRERRARHADLVHQRDRERLRGDGRRRPDGCRGDRAGSPDRLGFPSCRHRLRRDVFPEGLTRAEAARRELAATASSS